MPDSVWVENLYWFTRSAIEDVRETSMVPEPVSVPAAAAELMTLAEPGLNAAPELTVIVPLTLKFTVLETVAAVLAMVRLLKLVVEEPLMACAPAPLSETVPARAVKVPLLAQLPPTESAKSLALTSNVVPEPMVRLPPTASALAKVA